MSFRLIGREFLRDRRRFHGERGFTLIELLIVVAIIGIPSGIAMALFSNMQSRARISRAATGVLVVGV